MAQLNNDITVKPLPPAAMEQVVELSIVLTGEMYSDNLDDPDSLHYQALSRQLAEKVRLSHIFVRGVGDAGKNLVNLFKHGCFLIILKRS